MGQRETVEYRFYCPPGVQAVLACGSSAFIGAVDDSTILKYPLQPGGDLTRLDLEHQILTVVGRHPRIIGHKGFTETGLYLERAANGTIFDYLTASPHTIPAPPLEQRVAWCRELSEAVEHVHSKRVIHCDIQPTNVLVDGDAHLKLADFQGRHLSEDGDVVLDGWTGEPCRYFCPRDDEFAADFKTDIFALGSTIYFIMTGQEVFPDIISGEAGWDDEVKSRFARGIFPDDSSACSIVTRKCWMREYNSAGEVLEDIRGIERGLEQGSGRQT
ncbi:Serine/threonine-protein kinase SIK1 [Colletotrichum tanaceti]|uniref:Serine/threonine-protein kinase SIK1 n=1 Tax=Colletotrichum tanaceti TaxID=1306861 RepID=A0A4U6XTQ8_9PEZI|nr:Serine/threonine-protein kinase SIK1 [Colletotrichum tanaceti]TKW59179.1 Serine/threonine-protein kinase SIK1 [Colletotrichum tanaceti]